MRKSFMSAVIAVGLAISGSMPALAATAPAQLNPQVAVDVVDPTVPSVVRASAQGSTDTVPITGYSFDFGDGTAPVASTSGIAAHRYAAPGNYHVIVTVTDSGGAAEQAEAPVAIGSAYVPMSPVRVLDTRNGIGGPSGKIRANSTRAIPVAGLDGIPAGGVTAVVLNLTGTDATAATFLTAYPTGTPRPATSNLNLTVGATVPNLVTVPVGADGTVTIYNHVGTTDVIADIEGYYSFADDTANGFGEGFTTADAITRQVDTRTGLGVPKAKVGANTTLKVPGLAGNPATTHIVAAILNVTVTDATAAGFLTVSPDGSPRPTASDLNFTAGATVSNLVIAPVGQDGTIDFYNHVGSVDVLVATEGFIVSTAGPGELPFQTFSPIRLLDTRNGTGGPVAKIGAGQVRAVEGRELPGGRDGVDLDTVVLNVTVTNATANTFVTVYPDSHVPTNVSNVNISPGRTVSIQVVVATNVTSANDGTFDIFNHVGSVDVVVDLFGFFSHD